MNDGHAETTRDDQTRDRECAERERRIAALQAKVDGMKYMLLGVIMLETGQLLESVVGVTAALAGPIFCAVFVVYGVFIFYNYGLRQ
ncbi:hypothetical protein JW905_16110 [bacterium]|nr:hypothetical protein [candidate division CSSED10-310 bacterium]